MLSTVSEKVVYLPLPNVPHIRLRIGGRIYALRASAPVPKSGLVKVPDLNIFPTRVADSNEAPGAKFDEDSRY